MKKAILKRRLRRVISEVMHSENPVEMHRCVSGEMVPMDSPECITDLEFRIEDAAADRDACNTRTDARVHYNGLLKVLRRKLKQSKKLQPENDLEVIDV
tara:strand:- start:4654 stop:4950 length:297 start_codon:yes stop_codon:yes gene_type:complete